MRTWIRPAAALCSAALALLIARGPALADDDAPAAPTGPVTFHKDVEPILQASCQSCHRPGQIGPFSLLDYESARPWAKSIRTEVLEGSMPPWHADPAHGEWKNANVLTETQRDTIVAWVDQGARAGNPADAPEPIVFPDGGWALGIPDLVWRPAEPYTVGAEILDEYRCYVIPAGAAEDIWMIGNETLVDNPQVVHHIMAFMDTSGKARELDAADPKPGFECGMSSGANFGLDSFIGGWAPGNVPPELEEGTAFRVAEGTDIVMQVHYHNTTGEDQTDQSAMGVYLARETVRKEPTIGISGAFGLNIPAGDPNAEHIGKWRSRKDITLSGLTPHMHYLGKDMTVTAIYPDGTEEILLKVPNYDFNWQMNYEFVEPKKIPADTIIQMVSHHDNSADNPANPTNPPKDVTWGEETDQEMAHVFLAYTEDDQDLNIQPKDPSEIAFTSGRQHLASAD